VNVLFLFHRIPYPPDKGEKIRAFHMLEHLAARHTVHVGAFVDDPADMAHCETVRRIAGGDCLFVPLGKAAARARMALALASGQPLTTSYFASSRLDRWIDEVLAKRSIDRVVLFSSAMAPFLLKRRGFDGSRVILDMVDVDSDKWSQYAGTAKWPMSMVYAREARTLFGLERRAAAAFGATLLVSPFEAKTFADLAPETRARVHSVVNGVDLSHYVPEEAFRNPYREGEVPVVMVGTMDYRPNSDGAIWFAEQVLPLVRAKLPSIRFYAVGAKPTPELSAPRDGVVVTGRVDDVRPYVAHAAAVVAPLRLARGIQNKVLEGMAMRKPVVATVAASRGLQATPGVDLWVEDEPQRFAHAVIEAATGPDRERIAANGRRRVERDYDWATNLAVLDRLLESEQRDEMQGIAHGWGGHRIVGEGAE
jgi:sugar transferase (PEP-CTERM/EpsH1 system associated)